ncbi:MAG: hypothetical protein ACH346_02735, partial [Chthoniobacterales bacterium]
MLSRLFFLCLLASLALSNLSAEEPFVKEQVTAANYCNFLNHRATASDPDHLYSETMGSDPLVGCITRVGAPGQWHYEVVAGRENVPITYITQINKARYSDWLEESEAGRLREADDGASSSTTSTSTSNFNSHIEDVS